MIAFDYLHSERRHWLRKAMEARPPERLRAGLLGVLAAMLFACGAFGIERYRLAQALRTQMQYRAGYESSEQALAKTRIYYERVAALAALDRRVGRIVESGDRRAAILAQVANSLPPHAWLTSVERDETGLVLEGQAADLEAVARVLHGLMRAPELSRPLLAGTQATDAAENRVKYTVHVDAEQP